MTALSTPEGWSPSERQEAARSAYLDSLKAGTPLTGAELGRRFGLTDRWGRLQIGRFRAELASGSAGGKGTGRNDDVSVSRNSDGTDDRDVPTRRDGKAPSTVPEQSRPGADTVVDRNATVVPLTTTSGTTTARRPEEDEFRAAPEPPVRAGSVPPEPAAGTEPPAEASVVEPRPEASPAEAHRSWVDALATLTVALVCAAASYGHMYHVAVLAGEPTWIARAWPITVDGLVIAALRRGSAGRRWLALGIAVSMAANVLAQFPELAASAGPFVSAWPPIALYGTHRLSHTHHRPPPSDTPTEAPD